MPRRPMPIASAWYQWAILTFVAGFAILGILAYLAYAQNCVRVCPKAIPLTTSISIVYGQVMRQAIGDLFHRPETTREE